ncbi:MAG: leuC, partial [Desulfacinum sp.]|nr:leuC [Desulfacinum sp.]
MHAIEKILARASGKDSVRAGEIVNCRVDLAEVNDLYPQTIHSFYEMGGRRVHSPDRIT